MTLIVKSGDIDKRLDQGLTAKDGSEREHGQLFQGSGSCKAGQAVQYIFGREIRSSFYVCSTRKDARISAFFSVLKSHAVNNLRLSCTSARLSKSTAHQVAVCPRSSS